MPIELVGWIAAIGIQLVAAVVCLLWARKRSSARPGEQQ
jgi:hypothetical protein